MSSIIRIKRSGTNASPSQLLNGELAYSYLVGDQANGGDRLYVGTGDAGAGIAQNIVAIGGKYFTDKLDHVPGTLTANSAILVDNNSKIDQLNVDNLTFDGLTISSDLANGSITIQPTGTGVLTVASTTALVLPVGNTAQRSAETLTQGAIRYNTSTSAFEGYNGANWVSLQDVYSVDRETNIVGGNDDTLRFTTNSVERLTLNTSTFDLKSTVVARINSTTASTSTSTGALVVSGGVGIGEALHVNTSVTSPIVNAGTLSIATNTITATGTDSDVVLLPNGAGEVNVSGFRVVNLGSPINATDAATKQYVDEVAQGITARPSARAATLGPLDATYLNGNLGVGATLTATSNTGFPLIDGVGIEVDAEWEVGDRVLVKNQVNAAHNGLYEITEIGNAGTPWVLTRFELCDDRNEIPSSYVFVQEGATIANTGWVAIVDNLQDFTVGTDTITWIQFSGAGTYTAGTALSLDGTTFNLNVGTNAGLSVNGSNELIINSTIAGAGLTWTTGVIDVVGTADRITVNTDSIDIASTYVGQTSITTLGTITTGTWNATTIAVANGGTGLTTLTPNAVFISNADGTTIQFITGTEGDVIQFNASGVPVASNILDGGTY